MTTRFHDPTPVAGPVRRPTLADWTGPAPGHRVDPEPVPFLLLPSRALGLPRSAGAPFPLLGAHLAEHTRTVLELDP